MLVQPYAPWGQALMIPNSQLLARPRILFGASATGVSSIVRLASQPEACPLEALRRSSGSGDGT